MSPEQQAAIVADGILTGLVRCDFYGGQERQEFLERLRQLVERWEDEADCPHSRLCLDVRDSILAFIKQEQMIHEQQSLRDGSDPVAVPILRRRADGRGGGLSGNAMRLLPGDGHDCGRPDDGPMP